MPRAVSRHSTILGVAMILAMGAPVGAQERNPLFSGTRDPNVIKSQLQHGLASLERSVRLLQGATDPAQAATGVDALREAYKYLRAAQESSERLNRSRKFPDPAVQVRDNRVSQVRDHLLNCSSAFTPDQEGIAMCTNEATAALRTLRVTLEVFP
jgi:hypothetical protein